ncbi:MAG: hypothetical protein WCJ01_03725 [Ignavibacteria bacterium]
MTAELVGKNNQYYSSHNGNLPTLSAFDETQTEQDNVGNVPVADIGNEYKKNIEDPVIHTVVDEIKDRKVNGIEEICHSFMVNY